MEMFVYIGVIFGILLYGSKLYIMKLALSSFPNFSKRIEQSPLALVAMDGLFGFLGMHVIMIAGGSLIAMLTMITFGTCSVLYIMFVNMKWKVRNRYARNA